MSVEIQKRFYAYHALNPHVYEAFEELALKAARRGKRNFGSKAIFEILRWDSEINMKGPSCIHKMENNFTAYYAREFEKQNPEFKGFFRKIRCVPEDFGYDPNDSELW